jgi:uncharacterized membrane protein
LAMPNIHVLTGAGESPAYPVVRKIGVADLKDAVAEAEWHDPRSSGSNVSTTRYEMMP